MKNTIWYNKQSKEWMEGLPIGNGRLAAMIWGDESKDRLSLNHEWLWRGVNKERDNEPVSRHLPEIRKLLEKGDFLAATCLANSFMGGMGGVSGKKCRVDAYQPAGDLVFELKDSRFNRRQLNIDEAVVTVYRTAGGNRVISDFIAHPGYNLIIGRWHSDEGRFSGEMRFTRPEDRDAKEELSVANDRIGFHCAFAGGISYKAEIAVESDGCISCGDKSLSVNDATYVIAFINIATSVTGISDEISRYPVPDVGWEELLASHKAAFSKVYGRLKLEIDLPEPAGPTDEVIEAAKNGEEDPFLMLRYFNYGRYLLVSSSIAGELPANLQGKWNDRIDPPWECDYHFDINLQMNYWMAEAADMPECAEALLKYVERFVPHARKAAKDLYGCRGIWLPIQTDAWGRATPESYGWAVWIGAAPWIAQHFWRHYEYSGDVRFLRDRAYPFFKEVVAFYEDYLAEDAEGILQIMPSQSPENRFEGTGDWPVSLGISSAMDVQLANDAFGYAIRSAEILGTDSGPAENWRSMRGRLPKLAIGSDGRLLEWDRERKEVEPGHRHLSHLYGLYPSDIINPSDTPALYKAAVASLEVRLARGGGHTGWSRAWVACLYARIGDNRKLWENLYGLIKDFATVTLLDLHPPRIFQIDGNLGVAAAVLEGLVQSWGGKLHLLRALPQPWANGRLSGVKTPGGHVLDLEWKEGKPVRLEIILGYAEKVVLADVFDALFPEKTGTARKVGNSVIKLNENDILIEGKKGERFVF